MTIEYIRKIERFEDQLLDRQIEELVRVVNAQLEGLDAAIADTASDLADHVAATEAHGATGAVMGTTNVQTVSNKAMDSSNKYGGAAHYTYFKTNGTMVAHGDAVCWKDIDIDLGAQTSGGSAPALVAVNGDPYIKSRAFTGTGVTVEQLGGSKELAHEMLFGTDIIPHIHWAPTDAAAGNVKWQLRYMLVNRADVYTGGATISVVSAAPGVAWQGLRADFPPISTVGISSGSRIMFVLFRDPADPQDTYGSPAIAPNFGVHIQVDMLGTDTVDDK